MTDRGAGAGAVWIDELARQSRRIELGPPSSRVVWRAFGAGTPFALLHGGHGSWMHWLRNIPALSQRFELFVPDMPGFGESALGDPPPALGEVAARLAGDLDRLTGGQPYAVAGFSFGGLVAAALAATVPQRVSRLALVGAAGSGTARRDRDALRQWRGLPDEAAVRAALRHNLRAHMLSSDAAVDDLALEIHLRSCRATRFRSRDISRRGGLQCALDRFGGPTLLLWGRQDVTTTPECLLPRLLSQGRRRAGRLVEGAGHWAQFEQHAAVDRALIDFLDGRA